ncbi:hypothetical protein CDL12_17307 [Handroanthus impetiginosus]|uniref:Uncharacterized protein n=1 Tax=Handroanthus impetiginosus TaxID=429701 RepID=A0A2G9GXU9_9LAMI|nr:hypothetical protein CDL12_17307 [Handroanthus impetiginosus]
MDSINTRMQKDCRKEDDTVNYGIENQESKKGVSLISNKCGSKLDHEQTLISNVRRSRANSSCPELFLPSIPKHITTVDEKYVLRCLELIRNCAVRAAASNFDSKVHVLPDDLSSLAESKTRLPIARTSVAGTDIIIDSANESTIGSVTGSRSMMNILKSPLLRQFGSIDLDVDFAPTTLSDVGGPVYSHFSGSPHKLSNTISHKPGQKEVKVVYCKYASPPEHIRHASVSSTNSSCSDKLPLQGMLQCTWKDGLPRHVFSVDDRTEVYVANLSKVESSDNKLLDYVYTFHSRKNGKREYDTQELDSGSVGTMRVSTSITFGSNNSQVSETQFILSASNDDPIEELQTPNHAHRKNKRLTKKVANAFHTYKQRSSSKLWGSSAIFEDVPGEMHKSVDPIEAGVEKNYVPNLELAAIMVKDIYENRKEADLGGWGLKFLKKSVNKTSLETSAHSESTRNDRECSTSIDILVPAGLHGGPKTRLGGPSSLTERWISGGQCDCGGWDIGCPLTILNPVSTSTGSGECKTTDLFIKGSKEDVPMLKMVNIHEGLYYLHFQSTLSSLQSFAIAVAIIHSHSPLLRPEVYRS